MNDLPDASVPRKSVSKRIRFEVFKRDNFECQYCGRTPPAVTLECDHIFPIALGGTDEIDNLTTACMDCNRGKSAVPLSSIPQSLSEKSAETAEREAQLRGYYEIMEARKQRLEDDIWRVVDALWDAQECSNAEYSSIKRLIERGGVYLVLDAADITRAANVRGRRQFLYFCKVCWNKISEAER